MQAHLAGQTWSSFEDQAKALKEEMDSWHWLDNKLKQASHKRTRAFWVCAWACMASGILMAAVVALLSGL